MNVVFGVNFFIISLAFAHTSGNLVHSELQFAFVIHLAKLSVIQNAFHNHKAANHHKICLGYWNNPQIIAINTNGASAQDQLRTSPIKPIGLFNSFQAT